MGARPRPSRAPSSLSEIFTGDVADARSQAAHRVDHPAHAQREPRMIRRKVVEALRQALAQAGVCAGLRAVERAADVLHDLAQIRLDLRIEARSAAQLFVERVEQFAQTLFGHGLAVASVSRS